MKWLRWLGIALLVQEAIVLLYLASRDVQHTLATQTNHGFPGKQLIKTTTYDAYSVIHEIEDGIERITYRPNEPQHATPMIMQHGMWHGAWCWENWQRLWALQGWESRAHSLPGHALSPTQRPIQMCTLDYYLSFLKREIDRCPTPPILMGHSMGGALSQWYLKHVADDLPAVVLVAPHIAAGNMRYAHEILQQDIVGMVLLTLLTWSATPWIRNPRRAAEKLISANASMTPEALHARLGPESALVLYQHSPPFWKAPTNIHTPMLVIGAELDTVCLEKYVRATAEHYQADYRMIRGSAHNLMMDGDFTATAMTIHEWLTAQGIA